MKVNIEQDLSYQEFQAAWQDPAKRKILSQLIHTLYDQEEVSYTWISPILNPRSKTYDFTDGIWLKRTTNLIHIKLKDHKTTFRPKQVLQTYEHQIQEKENQSNH